MDDDKDVGALVDGARRHENIAAAQLIQELYPLVARIVRGYRSHRTAEEDLCQMIFVKIFRNLDQYSGKVPISHWVSRIAVNTCRNVLKAEKARPELRQADLSPDQIAVVENLANTSGDLSPDRQIAARELLEKLLNMLKPVERLLVDMLYLQNRTVAEVQKLTGWSAAKIRVTAFRARQKLRKQVGALL